MFQDALRQKDKKSERQKDRKRKRENDKKTEFKPALFIPEVGFTFPRIFSYRVKRLYCWAWCKKLL